MQLNVNHTVDSADPDDGSQEAPEMKSRPDFEVEIVKPGGRTLAFSCSYVYDHDGPEKAAQEEGYGEETFHPPTLRFWCGFCVHILKKKNLRRRHFRD